MAGPANVATEHPAYTRQKHGWILAQALLDGTEAMRGLALGPAGYQQMLRGMKPTSVSGNYLPREQAESPEDYVRRVNRSFLHPMFARAVGTISSRPFSKPVSLNYESANLPDPLQQIERDADRMGLNLTGFAKDLFQDAWSFGLCHALVEFPTAPSANLSPHQERALDLRPYFARIHPLDLTGWDTWIDEAGREHLTRIQIRERVTESHGWDVEDVTQYRVIWWDPDMPDQHVVELYREQKEGEWEPIGDPVVGSYPGIPLCTFYMDRIANHEARPPMRAMMDLNVAHWQSSSDQRQSLKFARVAPIVVRGVDEDWTPRSMGYGQVWDLPAEADAQYLEGTGVALQAGERDIQDIEHKGEVLGLQPLVERTASSTATGKEIDASNAASDAQAAVERFEGFIRTLYEAAATWVGAELPEDFDVDIFSEFGIGFRAAQDLPFLFQMNSAGMLSGRTLLREVIRRGLLPESIDLDDELEMATEDVVRRAEAFPGIALANEAARQHSGFGGSQDDDEDEEAAGTPPRFGAE